MECIQRRLEGMRPDESPCVVCNRQEVLHNYNHNHHYPTNTVNHVHHNHHNHIYNYQQYQQRNHQHHYHDHNDFLPSTHIISGSTEKMTSCEMPWPQGH